MPSFLSNNKTNNTAQASRMWPFSTRHINTSSETVTKVSWRLEGRPPHPGVSGRDPGRERRAAAEASGEQVTSRAQQQLLSVTATRVLTVAVDASSRPIVAPGKRKQADSRASDQAKERRKREEPFVLQNPERDGRRL